MVKSGIKRVFPFRFTPLYRIAGLPFAVTSATTGVQVDRAHLRIRFGPWLVRTPLSNVADVSITGPFSALKAAGPVRLSLADRGLTCATNGERGVCIQFAEPVRGVEPLGLVRHPAVTVTVADCTGLAECLTSGTR